MRRIHPQRSGRTEGERLKTAAVTEIMSSLRAQTANPFAPFCLRRPPAQAELGQESPGLLSWCYSLANSMLTSPLLLDTVSVFSPPSLCSGKLLSPFLSSD